MVNTDETWNLAEVAKFFTFKFIIYTRDFTEEDWMDNKGIRESYNFR